MSHKTGSSDALNKIQGYVKILTTTSIEKQNYDTIIPKGMLVFEEDTEILRIGDGETAVSALGEHKHSLLSPIGHTHMYGTNEPWLMTNPRLWYRNDLENHPELIALEGDEITDDKAVHLSEVYPGSKLLTAPVTAINTGVYNNGILDLTVDTYIPAYPPSALFNGELTAININMVGDQWLTGETDLDADHYVQMAIKNGVTYRPTEYWITRAFGTSSEIMKEAPTPKDFVLEGSTNGSTWVTLDSHSDVSWSSIIFEQTKVFEVEVTDTIGYYSHLRLRITAWNAGADETMDTGLRRLVVYGRKENTFALPSITSPSEDFVYVVPMQDLNVGLKHEDVGDLGVTSILPANLPAYRMETDGRTISKSDYSLLYAAIGHRYDATASGTYSNSNGSTFTGAWSSSGASMDYVDFTPSSTSMLGAYVWNATGFNSPSEILVEGYLSGEWVVLQSVTDIDTSEYEDGSCEFLLDTITEDASYTKYRFTVVEWNSDGYTGYGCASLGVKTHASGMFSIPTVTSEAGTAYIVTNNTAVDVSSVVVQSLQADMITLANAVASIQNQISGE